MNDALSQTREACPLITVLMSVYNGARWLPEAIESVLNQTFTDFEFLIIDDGSSDNSAEIIERFQSMDSRIIVISKPNTGLADSLNHGIQRARGEWIARLDADDICETTRLEKQIESASSNPKLVFIGTGLAIINEVGKRLATYSYPCQHAQLLGNLVASRRFPAHSSAFYQRRAVLALGGYRVRLRRSQDTDLWLRMSLLGELSCLRQPLIELREHGKRISHDESELSQLLYSRIVLVSYWLRRCGVADPIDADESLFKAFVVWLQARLVEDGFFEFHNHSAMLRSLLRVENGSRPKIMLLTISFIKHPFLTVRFIRERFLGETLARRLAQEWFQRSSSMQITG